MKTRLNAFLLSALLAILASSIAVSAESDPIFAQFQAALGYSDATSIDTVAKRLTSEWVGKPKKDVQGYIRRVIQNRGKLSAMKTGGRESRPDLLVLSHKSDLLQKVTSSLRVRFHYDSELNVSRVECTSS